MVPTGSRAALSSILTKRHHLTFFGAPNARKTSSLLIPTLKPTSTRTHLTQQKIVSSIMDLLIELGLAFGLASLLLALAPFYYMFITLAMLLGVLLLLAGVLGTLIISMVQKVAMHPCPLMVDKGIIIEVLRSMYSLFPTWTLPPFSLSLPSRSLRNPLVLLGGPLLLPRHQASNRRLRERESMQGCG